jgi:hypothetical protein
MKQSLKKVIMGELDPVEFEEAYGDLKEED